MAPEPFADRLAALVEARRSQVCLGLDPDPATLAPDSAADAGSPAATAAAAITRRCEELIERAGPACVAVKPQLACFERLGAAGWGALEAVIERARAAGLLVVADGKRGDVPVSAEAYAQALFGATQTPWGEAPGLGVDAATVNPLLGADAIEPLLAAAERSGAGVFAIVRSSNPGAADLLDLPAPQAPLHERLAEMVAADAQRLTGPASGLSGFGAVVGATEPRHLARLRELMPASIFLIPGVGAQGGRASDLRGGLGDHPASILVTASRSIAGATDPGAAADSLRTELWGLGDA